jgi:Tfp pilus assembly major pilin PilA
MVSISKDNFVLPTLFVISAPLIHGCAAIPLDKYQKVETRNMLVTAYSAG